MTCKFLKDFDKEARLSGNKQLTCVLEMWHTLLSYGGLILGSSQFQAMTDLAQKLLLKFKSGQI